MERIERGVEYIPGVCFWYGYNFVDLIVRVTLTLPLSPLSLLLDI